jgi:hypothetical protein
MALLSQWVGLAAVPVRPDLVGRVGGNKQQAYARYLARRSDLLREEHYQGGSSVSFENEQ